ncbi:hypothetical protein FALBO_4150 [Fusarium albosuccineum]|uniref:Uncharacterized protein n=1 Tax=Fusarium albosuccineum TaxID=1237068 RepID=A0A8H4PFC0_9HYPO|nr:hypothetical protein FALBO_4150 [Fusarium albosuccineum]
MVVFRKNLPSYVMPGQPVPPHREWISLDHNDLSECLAPWIGDNPTLEQRRDYMDLYLDWILTRGIDESEKIRQQAERNVVMQPPFWIDMSEDDFDCLTVSPSSPTYLSSASAMALAPKVYSELHLHSQESLSSAEIIANLNAQLQLAKDGLAEKDAIIKKKDEEIQALQKALDERNS